MFGLTRVKSLYPCHIQQDEWYMKFSFGNRGEGEKMYFNSVCVVWPDYINSLVKRDD